MNNLGIRSVTLLSLLIFTLPSFAQRSDQGKISPQPPKKVETSSSNLRKKVEENVELAERHQQSLLMLQSIEGEAIKLHDSIIKVKILVDAANSLWDYDKPRAIRLFKGAFDSIELIKLDPVKDQRMKRSIAMKTRGPLSNLRSEVLQTISRRDPKLAEKLRETFEESQSKNGVTNQNEKGTLDWEMAIAMANTQPEQTANFIRTHLQNDNNEMIAHTLIAVRSENQLLADQLFAEALSLTHIRPDEIEGLTALSIYIAPTEMDHFYGRTPFTDVSRKSSIKNFLMYLANAIARQAALGNPVNSKLRETHAEYKLLQSLLPAFELYLPNKMASILERLTILGIKLSSQQRETASFLRPEKTVDDLVREAESMTIGSKRDDKYMSASLAAVQEEDIERAISLTQEISDLEERSLHLSLVLYQSSINTLNKGDIEKALHLAKQIEFLPQRVMAFNRIAAKFSSNKQLERGQSVVEEIWMWTNKANSSPQKAKAVLTLASIMANYDEQKGFEYLQSAARIIDQTDFSLPQATGKKSNILQITLEMLDFKGFFSLFARLDFERASRVASSFLTQEAALFSQVIVYNHGLGPKKRVLPRNP